MTTVGIIEDDDQVRESLTLLINSADGYECTGAFFDCETGIEGVLKNPPDVLLMDIGLPGISGIEGIRKLKSSLPDLDVLVLTIHENTELVFEALCAGACGYLLKNSDISRLLVSIAEVRAGGSPMSTQIARMVVNSFQEKRRGPNLENPLTPRETEVLSELCKGNSYKMIAEALFISEETVRQHLKSIYNKLEVHSKSAAVARAYQDNLIPGKTD